MIREYIVKISDEVMENEIADKPEELVRCKDCRYAAQCIPPCDDRYCNYYDQRHDKDWFCADGDTSPW